MSIQLSRSHRTRRLLTGAALLAMALAIVPTIASAAIPHSGTGQINACYTVASGALRVVDSEAGQACDSTERALSWPSAGTAATQYQTSGPVSLAAGAGGLTTVLPGPVLPAGHYDVTMGTMLNNPTSQADTLRCGLYNGAGGLLRGDAVSIPVGYSESTSITALVTLTAPDRINVQCLHDGTTPSAGPRLQVYYANVVVRKVAQRF
ncbi:hypothetical protein [Micromonospora carbonacea]|uniref:Uncharacterized protein n=1 Tax=Micromonospora carbonacea TaxID=47853 RepID=A0A7H8XMP7_9ACTN|nr:hypothetical protein [Micromonospora carbonacea]MBB5826425.1 putative membrane protein [Micromonospora carbonacea]QLD25950.1 hypothetical protein HXZ27_18460 [Micromonospora carbonacea]